MRNGKPVSILEIVYHDDRNPHGGPAGDGSFVQRYKATAQGRRDAAAFCKGRHYYGKPATVTESTVSRSAAERYGLA